MRLQFQDVALDRAKYVQHLLRNSHSLSIEHSLLTLISDFTRKTTKMRSVSITPVLLFQQTVAALEAPNSLDFDVSSPSCPSIEGPSHPHNLTSYTRVAHPNPISLL